MKQETLEEAAEKYAHNYFNMHETNNYIALKQGYEAGAKEMAERMYSEEDMINFNQWVAIMYPNQHKFLITSDKRGFYTTKELLTKWFEQFKKK